MPTATENPPETTLNPADMTQLGSTVMDLGAQHARLSTDISRVEMEIRLILHELVTNHEDPDAVRSWLVSQPFANLGWQIPANCLPPEVTIRTQATATNANAMPTGKAGNGAQAAATKQRSHSKR